MVTAAEISRKRMEEELAETRARLAFAQRQLKVADQHKAFTDENYTKLRTRLSQERQTLEEELQHTIEEQGARSHALEAAQRQLERQVAKQPSSGARTKSHPASVV